MITVIKKNSPTILIEEAVENMKNGKIIVLISPAGQSYIPVNVGVVGFIGGGGEVNNNNWVLVNTSNTTYITNIFDSKYCENLIKLLEHLFDGGWKIYLTTLREYFQSPS